MKPDFYVYDDNDADRPQSLAEAVGWLTATLDYYRDEANFDGEWHDSVESIAGFVQSHRVVTVPIEDPDRDEDDDREYVDYRLERVPLADIVRALTGGELETEGIDDATLAIHLETLGRLLRMGQIKRREGAQQALIAAATLLDRLGEDGP